MVTWVVDFSRGGYKLGRYLYGVLAVFEFEFLNLNFETRQFLSLMFQKNFFFEFFFEFNEKIQGRFQF